MHGEAERGERLAHLADRRPWPPARWGEYDDAVYETDVEEAAPLEGVVEVQESGSHVILRHADGRRVTVPVAPGGLPGRGGVDERIEARHDAASRLPAWLPPRPCSRNA